MSTQWEEFEFGPGDKKELRVTLTRKGEITIGAVAVEAMGEPEAAVLLWDKAASRIGIKRAPVARATNAFPLLRHGKWRHRVIRASRFCRHHRIRVERTVAFQEVAIDDDGVLVLD